METTPTTAKDGHVTNHYINLSAPTTAKADTSVTDWLLTFLVMIIPLVNIIMLFVWAFGSSSDKPSRANWAKAGLLWVAIVTVLYILIVTIVGAGLFAIFNG